MVQNFHLGEREREILTSIVDQYISTGEPVGSRTLTRLTSEGLSSATIRNVMSDLADAGYLEQPHTSAGRVPTPQAYRFYVDQLTRKRSLPAADQSMINESLQGAADADAMLERTSHVLSLVSRSVGLAVAIAGPKPALDHVHFSRLAEHKILAVVVTRNGVVCDRVLRLDRDLAQQDLDVCSRYINENFRGWTMEDLRSELERRIAEERSEYDRLMQSVAHLYRQGALDTANAAQSVFVEGAANLVAGEQDAERLRNLLRTLDEKQKVVDLLKEYVKADQPEARVVIGLEDTAPYLRNFVLIGAPARLGDDHMGSVAVLGSTRIDYEHTITAVQYVARLLDELLNGSN
jgi:heat-inducible transcriptional repressor